jgi:FkbM family methyltransferase
MDLFSTIKNSPLLRPNAIPVSKNIGVVCLSAAILHIPEIILKDAKAIFIIDGTEVQCKEMENTSSFSSKGRIPVMPIGCLAGRIDLDIVFYHHVYEYAPFCSCWRYLRAVGYDSFYTFMPIPYNAGITTTHTPDYYASNRESLEAVFSMLSDEESRLIFAARIRAVESGNVGYIRVSDYNEYFHPLVRPEPGDVIMDGGVSESVGSQIEFIKAAGPEGRIFGFEPDPKGFCAACERIKAQAPYDTYKVIPFGMWHRRDTIYFEIAGQGTHATGIRGENSLACEVLPVDELVKTNHLGKVDFIKMDVEGSEVNALKGAAKTILKFRPKMAISIYHMSQDLYFIPLFLKNMCSDYEFYIGHHHASLHETILYANPK